MRDERKVLENEGTTREREWEEEERERGEDG